MYLLPSGRLLSMALLVHRKSLRLSCSRRPPRGTRANLSGNRQFFGALIAGQVADWIGRRNSIAIALLISFGAVTLEFVSTTNEMFFGGKFMNGFATGILQTVAGSYIGEVRLLNARAG